MEPWHGDVLEFLDLKKNHGDEEMRARDLFYAMWVPDLFMERVRDDGEWCLFCPDRCPGLSDCCGEEFNALYNKYCEDGKAIATIKARTIWFKILDSQMETGTPYLLFKDSANKKSNQQNLGTIKSSNLCTEIIEYSNKDQTAVCNLASIGLPKFVKDNKEFDYEKLHEVTKVITSNLDRVIDVNFYPTDKTRLSNLLHRPIGVGIQGLADTFAMMDVPYHSDEAIAINKLVFETIYHAALERSNEIAISRLPGMEIVNQYAGFDIDIFTDTSPTCRTYKCLNDTDISTLEQLKPIPAESRGRGTLAGAYSSFEQGEGSPASKGILQFDMWGVTPSDRYDWDKLRTSIRKYGIRNSLLLAPMPTASTSQILGNNECFEPFTSNIYTRRTIAGDYIIANKHLMKELVTLGLWSEELKNNIIINKGSIQHIDGIPDHIKKKYRIVWEIPMKHMIDLAADRGAYIDQSQSLNLWLEDPDYKSLTSMHFYSWNKGLKTGIYYLRRKPKHQPQQFTIDPENVEGPCEMCSS